MSTTRVSSLSAGYRLPSTLTLAARRPTGMTSFRLPPLAPAPVATEGGQMVETPIDYTGLVAAMAIAAFVIGGVELAYNAYKRDKGMTSNGRRRSRRRHRRH